MRQIVSAPFASPIPTGVGAIVGNWAGGFYVPVDDVTRMPALDLHFHTPYDTPFFNRLPPAQITASEEGIIFNRDGIPTLQGCKFDVEKSFKTPGLGDAQDVRFVLAAGASVRALTRPSGKRVMLQIQNSGANTGNFSFGKQATANSMFLLANGSSSYLDASGVPQNEVWLFSAAGTTFVLNWIDVPE